MKATKRMKAKRSLRSQGLRAHTPPTQPQALQRFVRPEQVRASGWCPQPTTDRTPRRNGVGGGSCEKQAPETAAEIAKLQPRSSNSGALTAAEEPSSSG